MCWNFQTWKAHPIKSRSCSEYYISVLFQYVIEVYIWKTRIRNIEFSISIIFGTRYIIFNNLLVSAVNIFNSEVFSMGKNSILFFIEIESNTKHVKHSTDQQLIQTKQNFVPQWRNFSIIFFCTDFSFFFTATPTEGFFHSFSRFIHLPFFVPTSYNPPSQPSDIFISYKTT